MTAPLEIITLDIHDFKRIRAVRIDVEPGTNVVTITGRNRQGKSSVLDAIAALIDSSKNKIDRPVRNGADEASIIGVFGNNGIPELVVKKIIYADGRPTKLRVEDADGVPMTAPASKVKALFGILSVDPTEFIKMDPDKQVELLLKLVGFNNDAWKAGRGALFAKRAVANAHVVELKNKLKGVPVPREDLPVEMPSVTTLVENLNTFDGLRSDHTRADEAITARRIGIERLKQEIAVAEENLAQWESYKEALPIYDPEARALVQSQIDTADTIIDEMHAADFYKRSKHELAVAEHDAKALTDKLKAKDQERDDALTSADLPVKGLSFGENGVMVATEEGVVEFSQASSAEMMAISTALAIAAKPRAGVIMLRDVSLMDSDHLDMIRRMAESHQMQVWEEVVNSTDDNAITIEDGEISV